MQLGTPITIISAGRSAIKEDKRNSKKTREPSDQITAMQTTIRQISTTRIERKKRKSKQEVTSNERPTKKTISPKILLEISTRKCGRPAK